jgi:hypothetical protein
MKRKKNPEPQLSKLVLFGLLFSITMYLTLSSISVYELRHLCSVLETGALKFKLAIAFVIAITTRVYLAFINSERMHWLKLILEFAPTVIIVILFLYSVPILLSKSCGINLIAILICDFMSILMVFLFERLLPEKYKWLIL